MRSLILGFAVLVIVGLAGAAGAPEIEAKSASYSQVVVNAEKNRFKAVSGWGTSSYGKGVYEKDYSFARPGEEPGTAQFKVEIPEEGEYAVYARWPRVKGLNAKTPFGVKTASGIERTKVNQRQPGGTLGRGRRKEMGRDPLPSRQFVKLRDRLLRPDNASL